MRILMVGFGVVGQSFAELIMNEAKKLDREYGLRPRIVGVVDKNGAAIVPDGIDIPKVLESMRVSGTVRGDGSWEYHEKARALDVIADTECEVMIETTPTELTKGEPGLSHIRAALGAGRHVITTNKGPLAVAMPALMELAHHNDVIFKFSGTVGGGTPVLDFAKKCLEGIKIKSISGILNGTSNYILTKMSAEGRAMKDALAEAQKLGYAEADPTYDIGGFDTAGKLVITSNLVLGTALSIKDVSITGVTGVTPDDIQRAASKGNVLKLIGKVGGGSAKVSPEEIPKVHPLNVSGTFNAILFETDSAGDITLVGKGAGGRETASSVLRDLIEIRRAFAR